ncbi:MAG: two-component sensor histidine kinase [Treponema sp.]|nr:two-component sensor histidine kinase [Treponema sp.]
MRDFVNIVSKKLDKLTQKQIENILETMADENDMLQSVFNSLATGLLICDKDWQLLYKNKAVDRFITFNIRNAELLHNDTKDIIPIWKIVDEKKISLFFQEVAQNNKNNVCEEFIIDMPNGNARIINITNLPLVFKRKWIGSIFQIEDITEKRNQEILLRRMENLSNLTNLAASVAHEIKNPLGAISIHVQLMQKAMRKARKEGVFPQEKFCEKYLSVVNEEIERLNKIIVDFLYAVRPISANIEPVDLGKVLVEFRQFLLPQCKSKNIDFTLEVEENLCAVMIDEKLFRQVLMNLAQNSINALKNGGKFGIKVTKKDEYILISVADNGCGMDEETTSKIFEPYFTTKTTGTGLGLTMAYKIIREFGGNIEVKSKLGEGTIFIITLPGCQSKMPKLEFFE